LEAELQKEEEERARIIEERRQFETESSKILDEHEKFVISDFYIYILLLEEGSDLKCSY
jgi:hypothetical protein